MTNNFKKGPNSMVNNHTSNWQNNHPNMERPKGVESHGGVGSLNDYEAGWDTPNHPAIMPHHINGLEDTPSGFNSQTHSET